MIIKDVTAVYNGQVTLASPISLIPCDHRSAGCHKQGRLEYCRSVLNSASASKVTPDNFDIGFAISGSNFTASCEEVIAHAILMRRRKPYPATYGPEDPIPFRPVSAARTG